MKDPLEFKKCSNLLHTCHISKHWLLDQQGTIAHHLSNSDSSLEKKCFLQVWIKLLQIQLLITWFHEIWFPNFHTFFTNEIVYWYLFIFMKPNETNIDWLTKMGISFFVKQCVEQLKYSLSPSLVTPGRTQTSKSSGW